MPPTKPHPAVTCEHEDDFERHQSWLEKLDERVRDLELSRAKLAGMMIVMSGVGSLLGGLLMFVFEHVIMKK